MQRLENTTPHFIRCIKPNNLQSPGVYEQELVLQQLRCCGVLEVVRISRSGFPTRMSHQKFARRWNWLVFFSGKKARLVLVSSEETDFFFIFCLLKIIHQIWFSSAGERCVWGSIKCFSSNSSSVQYFTWNVSSWLHKVVFPNWAGNV